MRLLSSVSSLNEASKNKVKKKKANAKSGKEKTATQQAQKGKQPKKNVVAKQQTPVETPVAKEVQYSKEEPKKVEAPVDTSVQKDSKEQEPTKEPEKKTDGDKEQTPAGQEKLTSREDDKKKQAGKQESPKHKEEFYPTAKTGYELSEKGDAEQSRHLAETMLSKMDIGSKNINALKSLFGKFDDYDLYTIFAFANVYDNNKGEIKKVDLEKLLKTANPQKSEDLKVLFEAIAYGVGLYELAPKDVEELIEKSAKPVISALADPFLQISLYSNCGAKDVDSFENWCSALASNKKLSSQDWDKIASISNDLAQTFDFSEVIEMVRSAKSQKELKQNVTKKAEGPSVDVVDVYITKDDKETGLKKGDTVAYIQKGKDKKKEGFVRIVNEEVLLQGEISREEQDLREEEEYRSLLEKYFGDDSVFLDDYFSKSREKDVFKKVLENQKGNEVDLNMTRGLNWHDLVLASGVTTASSFFDDLFEPIYKYNTKAQGLVLDSDELADLLASFISLDVETKDVLPLFRKTEIKDVDFLIDALNTLLGNDAIDMKVEEALDVLRFISKHYNEDETLELCEKVDDASQLQSVTYLDSVLDK